MRTSMFLLGIAASIATATAIPLAAHHHARQTANAWSVTNFECGGTSPAGCVYTFDIAKAADTSNSTLYPEPGFATTCSYVSALPFFLSFHTPPLPFFSLLLPSRFSIRISIG